MFFSAAKRPIVIGRRQGVRDKRRMPHRGITHRRAERTVNRYLAGPVEKTTDGEHAVNRQAWETASGRRFRPPGEAWRCQRRMFSVSRRCVFSYVTVESRTTRMPTAMREPPAYRVQRFSRKESKGRSGKRQDRERARDHHTVSSATSRGRPGSSARSARGNRALTQPPCTA